MSKAYRFSNGNTCLDTARMACAIVLLAQVALSARDTVVDPALRISVRTYISVDEIDVDLETARAYVETAFRQTGIVLEWLDCNGGPARSHCAAPPQADELVVRILAARETGQGSLVVLGKSLVDGHSRSGTFATVYADRVAALARRANIEAAPVLGRAIAHEVGHLLLGTSRHGRRGLMREVWSAVELRRNQGDDWVFLEHEAAAIRAAVATRQVRKALIP
jgi:hypothetical protein